MDVSGISIFAVDYVDIDKDELMAPEAREFVEEGIAFAKDFLLRSMVKDIIAYAGAIDADKPVLFRDQSGEVGLMVRLTAFGSGKVESGLKLPVEWIGEKKKLWKVENFAYFKRNEFYRWEYGGLVF